jgi:hypothetical protein
MVAPSTRQIARGNGTATATVTLASQPNVGNRLLAVVSARTGDAITPADPSWISLDSVTAPQQWSAPGHIEIFYRDTQVGDSSSWTFNATSSYDVWAFVHEIIDFTELPVIRDAYFNEGLDTGLPTLSVGANSMSIMVSNYNNNPSLNNPAG